jgi:putative ABC transport system permease protein
MALGAQPLSVIGLVPSSSGRIVTIGTAIGLFGAIALWRLLGAALPSMQTDGALVGAAGTAILIAVAVAACYLPARRAVSVNPIDALRAE